MLTVSHCINLATTSLHAYYNKKLLQSDLMSPSEDATLQEPSAPLPVAVEPIEVQVEHIKYEDTCPLRRDVLRPDLDIVYYDGDLNRTSIHLGGFVRNELVGVISMFLEDLGEVKSEEFARTHLPTPCGSTQWRIRGFAVDAKMRSRGVGTKLIETCVRYAKDRGGKMIWCVARCSAEVVYRRQGFGTTGDIFDIEGVGSVVHMFKHI